MPPGVAEINRVPAKKVIVYRSREDHESTRLLPVGIEPLAESRVPLPHLGPDLIVIFKVEGSLFAHGGEDQKHLRKATRSEQAHKLAIAVRKSETGRFLERVES